MKYNQYFGDWVKVINKGILDSTINIINREYSSKTIEPKYTNVFKAFTLCSLNNLKIVFLGQDPYPQRGVATGILFGNKENTTLSPSLEIIKEACIDNTVEHGKIEFDNTLESWGTQGILLLNSALTVERNKAGSHTSIWRPFISSLLSNISNTETGIVYVLFGNQAQTFTPYINSKFNTIIKVPHPAYYARTKQRMPSDLFKKLDELMLDKYGQKIKWYNNG